jgi:hypothetical protein
VVDMYDKVVFFQFLEIIDGKAFYGFPESRLPPRQDDQGILVADEFSAAARESEHFFDDIEFQLDADRAFIIDRVNIDDRTAMGEIAFFGNVPGMLISQAYTLPQESFGIN